MNNNQLLAVLLILFGLISCYMGVEKNRPTAAETGIKTIIELLNKVLPKSAEVEHHHPKRGTVLIIIGALLGIVGGFILITEARRKSSVGKEPSESILFKQD